MNRRGFIGALLGTAAATALPSEIWPFRKIFLPSALPLDYVDSIAGIRYFTTQPRAYNSFNLPRSEYPGRLALPLSQQIQAIQLEKFAKEIPELFYREMPVYKYFKSGRTIEVTGGFKTIDGDGVRLYDRETKPSLLHAPATPENIMEFIDDLEKQKS